MSMRIFVVSLASSFALAGSASAQLDGATLQGTVKSESGENIAEAAIVLQNLDKGAEIRFSTDDKGYYYRRGIPAGNYSVTVSKEGFTVYQDQFRINAGEEKRMHVQLTVSFDDFNRGVELFNQGDLEGAAEAFEAATQKTPEMAEAYLNLGLIHLQLNRLQEGIAALEEAIELNPGQGQTEIRLAAAYAEAERTDDAVKLFEQGISHVEDPSEPMAVEAALALGTIHFGAGRVDEALAVYEKLLAVKPQNPRALLGVGMVWFNKGDTDKARTAFEAVVAAAPDSAEATQAKSFLDGLKPSPQ